MDKEVPDLPYVLRPRGLRTGLTALLSAVAVFVVPAAAQAACQSTPTTKPFQVFNDQNDYSLVPNGGFELGAGGWSLAGAGGLGQRVVVGPRGRRLEVAGHRCERHRRLADGLHRHHRPTYRFFARRTSGSWGVLNLRVRWQDCRAT